MAAVSQKTVRSFAAFINKAKTALPAVRFGLPIEEFRAFIDASKPVVIRQIRKTLAEHRPQIKNLCHWLLPPGYDLLAIAGLSGFEDSYTNLLKWMLYPPNRPDLALRCQQAWLKALNLSGTIQIDQAAEPNVQLMTIDGRVDIVLHFEKPEFLLIAEAKIGSAEHETPSRQPQTSAYPPAVRHRLGLSKDYPGAMIFLTPDGFVAQDQLAINSTYDIFISAIGGELSPEELPSELRYGYSLIITHLLTKATAGGKNKAEILRELHKYLEEKEFSLTDEQIFARLGTLGPICRDLN